MGTDCSRPGVSATAGDLVLVTGGCGFIGRHVCTRLRHDGARVRVLDSLSEQVHGSNPDLSWLDENDIELIRESVCDKGACRRAVAGASSVVHLAAETGTGQSMYEMTRHMSTNICGTSTLLEVCAEEGVHKFVLCSSRAVYGEGKWRCDLCGPVHPGIRRPHETGDTDWWAHCPQCGRPLVELLSTDERSPLDPVSVYGISKLTQELLVKNIASVYALDASILRLFNVYGPGQSLDNPYTGVLGVFFNRARAGKDIELYEDGKILRDLVYIDDVVEAICRALSADNPPMCNIGLGRTVSVHDLAEKIISLTASSSRTQVTGKGRAGDVRGLLADVSTAAAALGWAPSVSVDAGLEEFVRWAEGQPTQDLYEQSLSELVRKGLYR